MVDSPIVGLNRNLRLGKIEKSFRRGNYTLQGGYNVIHNTNRLTKNLYNVIFTEWRHLEKIRF